MTAWRRGWQGRTPTATDCHGWIDGWYYIEEHGIWTRDKKYENGNKEAFEYEDNNLNGKVDGDTNHDDVMDGWESWTETSPGASDSDVDGLNDGLERAGWNVTIFYERNPDIIVTIYKVYSSPLNNDTDDDGLSDVEEWIFLGDPNKDDTDGDGYLDEQELGNGSSVCGIECNKPEVVLVVDPSAVWEPINITLLGKTITIGWRLKTVIDVEVQGRDVSGIQDIDVRVTISNLFGDKEDEDNQPGDYFYNTFSFDFDLLSTVGEVFSGWTVTVEVTDNNGNTKTVEYRIDTVFTKLIDAVNQFAEALDDFRDYVVDRGLDAIRNLIRTTDLELTQTATCLSNIFEEEELGDVLPSIIESNNIISKLPIIYVGITCIVKALVIIKPEVSISVVDVIKEELYVNIMEKDLGISKYNEKFSFNNIDMSLDWSLEKLISFIDLHLPQNLPYYNWDNVFDLLKGITEIKSIEDLHLLSSIPDMLKDLTNYVIAVGTEWFGNGINSLIMPLNGIVETLIMSYESISKGICIIERSSETALCRFTNNRNWLGRYDRGGTPNGIIFQNNQKRKTRT